MMMSAGAGEQSKRVCVFVPGPMATAKTEEIKGSLSMVLDY